MQESLVDIWKRHRVFPCTDKHKTDTIPQEAWKPCDRAVTIITTWAECNVCGFMLQQVIEVTQEDIEKNPPTYLARIKELGLDSVRKYFQ